VLGKVGFLSPNRIHYGHLAIASIIWAIEFYAFLDNPLNIPVLVTLSLTKEISCIDSRFLLVNDIMEMMVQVGRL